VLVRLLLAALLCPASAYAAGLGLPDLGANGMGQAGAWIAHPTDGTALYYNPAGLASQPGWNFQLDGRITAQAVMFQRADSPEGLHYNAVSNTGSPSIAPMIAISYRWDAPGLFPITFAIGGHPFNGMTGFVYPDPIKVRAAQGSNVDENEVAQATPQRYSSVQSTSQIYVPVIAIAAQVRPWLSLGVGLQLAWANIQSRQAIFASPTDLDGAENSSYDAVFNIHATKLFQPSGIVGASAEVLPGLFVGGAVQLPTFFRAQGTITEDLPDSLTKAGIGVKGNQVEVDLKFPLVARLGVRLVKQLFEVELAGTYEAWSMQKQITLIPKDIVLSVGGKDVALAPVIIHKNLQDAGSVRLGGILRGSAFSKALEFLSFRAGVIGETSAVPEQKQTIDTPSWQRIGLYMGLGARWRNYEFAVAYGHLFQPERTVTDSQAQEAVAFPRTVTPTIVGNGTYDSNVNMGSAMVSARFE
jgi:long-chain fatty acid transport protein